MSKTLGPALLDKYHQTTYLLLFTPKPDLPSEDLAELKQELYDLRRLIPDVLSVRIEETLVPGPGCTRFACLIGYRSQWALQDLITHQAFLQVSAHLETSSSVMTGFAANLYHPAMQNSIRLATPQEVRQGMSVVERLRLIVRDQLQLAESHVEDDANWVEAYDAREAELALIHWAIEDEFQVKVPLELPFTINAVSTWLQKQGNHPQEEEHLVPLNVPVTSLVDERVDPRLRRIFAQLAGVDESAISLERTFEDLDLDGPDVHAVMAGIHVLSLVSDIETVFQITLDVEEVARTNSVEDVQILLQEKGIIQ
jgi:acyl carrier protein